MKVYENLSLNAVQTKEINICLTYRIGVIYSKRTLAFLGKGNGPLAIFA